VFWQRYTIVTKTASARTAAAARHRVSPKAIPPFCAHRPTYMRATRGPAAGRAAKGDDRFKKLLHAPKMAPQVAYSGVIEGVMAWAASFIVTICITKH
jgi:hypothetical protein